MLKCKNVTRFWSRDSLVAWEPRSTLAFSGDVDGTKTGHTGEQKGSHSVEIWVNIKEVPVKLLSKCHLRKD